MNTKVSLHYIPIHGRPEDMHYIKNLQPRSIKIVDPDPNRVADLFAIAPNSLYVLRNHPISEQKQDMINNPIATGERHADELANMYNSLRARANGRPFPDKHQVLLSNVNEPNIKTDSEIKNVMDYTIAFCKKLRTHGLRGLVFNFSVGWPRNLGNDMPVDWDSFDDAYTVIKEGGHFVGLHEYWADQGPQENWLWWTGRFLQFPWDVPIIIGEFGLDLHVKYGAGHVGWRAAKVPYERYMTEIKWYDEQLRNDLRIHSGQLFTTDYGSADWENFDTRQLHEHIIHYNNTLTRTNDFAPDGFSPDNPINIVPIEQRIMFVAARDGLNVRNAPNGDKAGAIPFAEQVAVQDTKTAGNYKWAKIGTNRWVAEDFLSTTQPVVPTEPTLDHTILLPVINTGDKFTKTMNFIFKWEGGFSTDPNDPGNYINGVFVGTKYGISAKAHPHLNIKDLTKEQAAEIYRKEYWEASGADKMPWPLCMAHMNIAVNGGVGAAKLILSRSGHSFNKYMGEKIKWYTYTGNWNQYYTAWMRRCADLLIEADK